MYSIVVPLLDAEVKVKTQYLRGTLKTISQPLQLDNDSPKRFTSVKKASFSSGAIGGETNHKANQQIKSQKFPILIEVNLGL